MRLTHIKLAGFKSFTDPTTIHVPGQLVAVIGPNGCGKSNVIDAVRWVLGEASAKQLRGESMQDVIFNGAATRRPAPRASVELVFDNSDFSLQGEWGRYAEVSIKRQLTRQGDSTYYINNQIVRRRDITDLFLGTGVGARGYAVIEQGMISRIIEARPEELRAYLEEAAGLSKYKERRKETEARLKDTREHLQRLADLQGELTRQVEKLEKQAQTAQQYQLLTAQLNQQQDLLDFVQWQQALQSADKATEQHAFALQKQEELSQQQTQLNTEIQTLREQENAEQSQLQQLNAQLAFIREQSARLEEQIRSQRHLQQRLEREQLNAQASLQKIAHQKQQLDEEIELENNHLEEKQIELSEWAMQIAEREELLPELEERQNQLENAFQSQQDEINRIKRELGLKNQQLQHAEQNQKNHTNRQTRLQNELAALNLPSENEVQTAQQTAQNLQQEHEHYEELLLLNEEQTALLKQQFQGANAAYQAKFNELLQAQAKHAALDKLLNSQKHTNDFWQNTPYQNDGELWQNIQAPSEWQHALAVVLAKRLHAKAIDGNTPVAGDLPQGSAAWFDRNTSASKKNLPVQALINQLHIKGDFQAAVAFWLDGVLCAPNLAYALEHQKDLQNHQFWLTPEGHQVDKIGVLLFDKNDANQLIEQKNQLDALENALCNLQPECERLRLAQEQAEQQLNQHENHTKQLLISQREHAARWQVAQQTATELLAKTNQGQLRREHIVQELAQLDEENLLTSHSADGIGQDIATLSDALETLSQQQNQLGDNRNQQQNQLKQARLALMEANRQYGISEVARHKIEQKKQLLAEQIIQLDLQAEEWQQRQSELALEFEQQDANDEQSVQLETFGEQVFELNEQIANAQQKLEHTQELGRQRYAAVQQVAIALPQVQASTQTALLQQQEALINAKRFHQNLTERAADLEALEQLAQQSGNLKLLNQDIGNLAQQIQALGAVNLAALQELEEARERGDYYQNQSQDVQTAIAMLEEAIAQIDKETKTRFKETFDAANEKVQSFFPVLFGGGEASLHMIGDDLLTAGVSIMARPPGKRNSTIHLLSGGEKALTAISLVFSLFSLNPAPFCLLDEVDAPLDDANTSRFCQLVKEMSAQTQFLYISHNRITMEMAEQLIGVTMQEKGVSRIVAVDIQQALKMAEQPA
ncbi:MAG: chromosome segregation protein SMC [Neisseria sp.]|nr:chromosome segregation protein SMC [Neisseria sp.]